MAENIPFEDIDETEEVALPAEAPIYRTPLAYYEGQLQGLTGEAKKQKEMEMLFGKDPEYNKMLSEFGLQSAQGVGNLKELGKSLVGLIKGTGKAIVAAPKGTIKAAKDIYQYKAQPAPTAQKLSTELAGAAQKIGEKNVALKSTGVLKPLIGKTATIKTEQFKGTAIEPELERLARAQGMGVKQTSVPGLIDSAGNPIVNEVFKMPKKITVSGKTLNDLKGKVQKAAQYKVQAGTVEPPNFPAQKAAEKAAGAKLRQAEAAIAPKTVAANLQLGDQTRVSQALGQVAKKPGTALSKTLEKEALMQKGTQMSGLPVSEQVAAIKAAKEAQKGIYPAAKQIGLGAIKEAFKTTKEVMPDKQTLENILLGAKVFGQKRPQMGTPEIPFEDIPFEDIE